MHLRLDHGRAALLSGLALVACTVDNPNFGLGRDPDGTRGTSETGDDDTRGAPTSSGGTSSEATSDATGDATGDATSEPSASDASTGGAQPGTSGAETGSTGSAGPTGATGDPGETGASEPGETGASETTGAGESSTGAPGPVTIDVPADIGTCVLLPRIAPYVPQASPSKCESISAAIAGVDGGVMTLDTTLKEGAGQWREARIFLAFMVPSAPPGTTLTAATLTMHVGAGEGAEGSSAGALVAVEPFMIDELADDDPAPGSVIGVADGPAVTGQAVHWPFTDAGPVVAGSPLFLAVVAQGDDGVIYGSASATPDQRPTLTLTFE